MYPNTMPQQPTPPYGQGPWPPGHHASPPPPPPAPPRGGLRRVPLAFWIGLLVGAAAFVVHLSLLQTSTGFGDGYSCSYTDFAGYLAAAAIGVCILVGWVSRTASRAGGRLALPLMLLFTAALLALGAVHALRGNGAIMSPCDSHPLP